INDYGTDDEIRRDTSCNQGSLNIAHVMESGKGRESVHEGSEALTVVRDDTAIANAPGVKKANDELHPVGLGAMNLHGYLVKNKINYESRDARDFANVFFMLLNYCSLEKSMMIAKERGRTFKDFKRSDYATGEYFEKYTAQAVETESDKVAGLL